MISCLGEYRIGAFFIIRSLILFNGLCVQIRGGNRNGTAILMGPLELFDHDFQRNDNSVGFVKARYLSLLCLNMLNYLGCTILVVLFEFDPSTRAGT